MQKKSKKFLNGKRLKIQIQIKLVLVLIITDICTMNLILNIKYEST
jgi:hypothetical protein